MDFYKCTQTYKCFIETGILPHIDEKHIVLLHVLAKLLVCDKSYSGSVFGMVVVNLTRILVN